MKLFSSGAFYMHASPRLAAEWLNDSDTIHMSRSAGILLSTAIQYFACEVDIKLYPLDRQCFAECSDVIAWLQASQHNVAWMLDYFDALNAKCIRCFKRDASTLDFTNAVSTWIRRMEDIDTEGNWLPMTTSEARSYYRKIVKRYTYRKVRAPYWINDTCKPDKQTMDQATLDLLTFDLDAF